MRLICRETDPDAARRRSCGTADAIPSACFDGYVPLGGGEHTGCTAAIREAVPVVDAAIYEAHPAHRRL
jgi:hypothetical protein